MGRGGSGGEGRGCEPTLDAVTDGVGGGGSGGEGRGCEPTLDATASTASLAFLTTAALSLFNFSLPFLPMMGYLI